MNRKTFLTALVLFATAGTSFAQQAEGQTEAPKTKRVMVSTFLQLDRKVKDSIPLGQEIADMVTMGLVQRGARVVERAELAAVEKERGLQEGTADKASIQELGRLKGAAVAVMGKITEFNIVEKKGDDVARSLVGRIKPLREKAESKQYELRVALDVRLVSIETGDILAATTALVTEGTDESDINNLLGKSFGTTQVLQLGLTALGAKPAEPTPTDKASAWDETKAGKCAKRAVEQVVVRLLDKIPSASATDFEDMITLNLQVLELADYSEATLVQETLEKLAGVAQAELKGYTPEKTEITIKGSAKQLKGLVSTLLKDEALKGLSLKVASISKEAIVLKK